MAMKPLFEVIKSAEAKATTSKETVKIESYIENIAIDLMNTNKRLVVSDAIAMATALFKIGYRRLSNSERVEMMYENPVFCGDCKHYNINEGYCHNVEGIGYLKRTPEDYCSRGER